MSGVEATLYLILLLILILAWLKRPRESNLRSRYSQSVSSDVSPLPYQTGIRFALKVMCIGLCLNALADVLSVGWFFLHREGDESGPLYYIIASGYIQETWNVYGGRFDVGNDDPLSAFVPGLFPPLVFLLSLCLGGIATSLTEVIRLNSLPEQQAATKYWLLVAIGLIAFCLLFMFQPISFNIFGVWLVVLESLLFTLTLLAINRLAWWLLVKKPEDAVFVTKPFAICIAGFLSAVAFAWVFKFLNCIGPVGGFLCLLNGSFGELSMQRGSTRLVFTVLAVVLLIPHIAFFIYLAVLANYRSQYELAGVAQSPTYLLGAIKMKVFKNGEFAEEDEQPQEQSLAPIEQTSFTTLAKYAERPPSSFGLVDGLKSKVGSTIQKRVLEDQTKVTEAQAKAMEAQRKVLDQKVGLIETATKGQRAKNEYELLPEERQVKEMGYQVSKSELELQKMKLEMEKKKLAQMMNGNYMPEPEGVAEIKEARQKDKYLQRQTHMSNVEEDSITAQCQALDDWYDEKQAEIMGNQRLDVARRRQQLELLDKEYKLRKKRLDDRINALLEAEEGGAIHV